MPEIGEIARIVNRLRTHIVGKTISKVAALEDTIVYKDTTHDAFKEALEGKKVLAAKQWGKYFWLVMDSPPHPLMHFGMTGWIYVKNDPTAHYRAPPSPPPWPPKYLKFTLHLTSHPNEIAFSDPRRLARIRLIDHPDGHALRDLPPLSSNGPDPVLDPVSLPWLTEKLRSRKVRIKAWLLDQSALAGVGNWVADEILFQARLHPERYSHKLTDEEIGGLHKMLGYVTKFAVEVEADSARFPEDWLMLWRWGKGKKENRLPTGERIEFVKVGSRTSAFVPSLQKKGEGERGAEERKPKKSRGRPKTKKVNIDVGEGESEVELKPKKARGRAKKVKKEDVVTEDEEREVKMEAKPKKTRGRPKLKKETIEEENMKPIEEVEAEEALEEVEEEQKPKRGKRKIENNTKAPRGHPKKARKD